MLEWKVGEVTITCVVEGAFALPGSMLFPAATAEALDAIDWLKPRFIDADHNVTLSIQALFVRTPDKLIMVDTCMGNDKRRAAAGNMLKTDFLQRIQAAGFAREDVDVVLCTHLHLDHVGWNTMLVDGRWIPTFPNARYLIGRTEFDYWRGQTEGDDPVLFADSVQPMFDAGVVDLVEIDHSICQEVRLVSTPGHTPGHVSVRISSGGAEAMITGDMAHHPAQFARPDWASFVDYDGAASAETRRRVLGDIAGTTTLVIGTHFVAPTAGRIVRDGEAWRFEV
jgi:glyoxylase-like metal-dependent hydrolase (beta-lactamase superfamily II)